MPSLIAHICWHGENAIHAFNALKSAWFENIKLWASCNHCHDMHTWSYWQCSVLVDCLNIMLCMQTQTTGVKGIATLIATAYDCARTQYVIVHCGTEMSTLPSTSWSCSWYGHQDFHALQVLGVRNKKFGSNWRQCFGQMCVAYLVCLTPLRLSKARA